ncbi:MAG: ABC transporter ATP-binding protein [Halobacteria archaeon]
MPLIDVLDITAGYGNTTVLNGVSMEVDDGEFVCLIGPNGSGKSTVLKSIYGFADVFTGRISYDGADITNNKPKHNLSRGLSYVPQESSIFPDMTVEENMLMGGYILEGEETQERVDDLLRGFPRISGLRSRKAGSLSGGQRRLLEIARGLITEPEVLILDEPSIGLEPQYTQGIFETILELNEEGVTVLIVEQNAKKVLDLSDRGYVLAGGEIKFSGTGDEVLEDDRIQRLYLGATPE